MLENFVEPGKVSIIVDCQFGSSGKGLIADAISKDNHIDICCATLSPNSGHTTYVNGVKNVTRLLPVSGIYTENSYMYLSPESVIDVNILREEVQRFWIQRERLYIHPRASIVQTDESNYDKHLVSLGSTRKGTGPARASKILRRNPLVVSAGVEDIAKIDILDINSMLDNGYSVLIESGQGLDLGINYGLAYPYCTSKDVLPANLLADFAIHPKYLGNIMLVLRTYPIRVGNPVNEYGKEIGYSGPFYPDSKEITWHELGQNPELSSVTKRVRRVATFSEKQFYRAIRLIQPTHIFLNFVNYIRKEDRSMFERIFTNREEHVYFGYGPNVSDISSIFL